MCGGVGTRKLVAADDFAVIRHHLTAVEHHRYNLVCPSVFSPEILVEATETSYCAVSWERYISLEV